jgi:hypothetical protein
MVAAANLVEVAALVGDTARVTMLKSLRRCHSGSGRDHFSCTCSSRLRWRWRARENSIHGRISLLSMRTFVPWRRVTWSAHL